MTEKKERIIRSSSALFLRYGAKNITMDDIAKDLRMSKKTIYKYFPDKETILQHCLSDMALEHKKQRDEIFKNSENIIDAFITVMYHSMKEAEHINPVLIYELKRHYPELMENIQNAHKEDIYIEVERGIKQGIREELFREDINIDIVVKLLLLQSAEMSNVEVFQPSDYPPGELIKNVIINFLRGISTEKGRHLIESYLTTHQLTTK